MSHAFKRVAALLAGATSMVLAEGISWRAALRALPNYRSRGKGKGRGMDKTYTKTGKTYYPACGAKQIAKNLKRMNQNG